MVLKPFLQIVFNNYLQFINNKSITNHEETYHQLAQRI